MTLTYLGPTIGAGDLIVPAASGVALDPLLAEFDFLHRVEGVPVGYMRGDDWPNEGSAGAVGDLAAGASEPIYLDGTTPGAVHATTFSPGGFHTPDSTAIDVAGDLDLRARFQGGNDREDLEDRVAVIARITNLTSDPGYDDLSYELSIYTTGASAGAIGLIWVDTSDVQHALDSGVVETFDPYAENEVRATLDVDNGASGHTARFYVRDDADPDVTTTDLKGWRLLRTFTVAGVTDISDTSGPLTAASFDSIIGPDGYAEVYDGIDGTLAADFNPGRDLAAGTVYHPGDTWVSGTTGETWTVGIGSWVDLSTDECFTFDGTPGFHSFTMADDDAIDLAASDATFVWYMRPSAIATSNGQVYGYENKQTGTVGQGGTGWNLVDLKTPGPDGFGFHIGAGGAAAAPLANTGWTANAWHLVVADADRDGNLTIYVDDMDTPFASAALSSVPSVSTAVALTVGNTAVDWRLKARGQIMRRLTDDERGRLPELLGV